MSIREATAHFSVPKSTLGDRLRALASGKEVQMKPAIGSFQNTFSGNQEEQLYHHIKSLDNQLMPLNKN